MSGSDATSPDVLILGGGLAGLALARQFALELPAASITVLEAGRYPVAEAAFKVGESSVEVGAQYLADTLGLREHLDGAHLKKFGLRCFFGDGTDIGRADELGASAPLTVGAWQMDRGRLENHLHELVVASGVTVIDGAQVVSIDFDDGGGARVAWRRVDGPGVETGAAAHAATGTAKGAPQIIRARRVVDASGRRGLLRRRFDATRKSTLDGNAAWFRVDREVRIDDWCDDPAWRDRVPGGKRWLSTNHLMGPGYWVWLIPLASGATSVGIVADAAMHPLRELHTHARALEWLARHQPQCHAHIAGEAMDFHRFRGYAFSSERVFSRGDASGDAGAMDAARGAPDWALVGEAGQFVDPFYSPGLDFIAYGNTFVVDLVGRSLAGEDTRARRRLHEHTFATIHASTLALYEGQYPGFGNFRLMTLKTVWDYAYYWSVLGFLYFNGLLTEPALLGEANAALGRARATHLRVQGAFRAAAAREPVVSAAGRFADHSSMPLVRELNASLAERVSAEHVGATLARRLARLETLGADIVGQMGATVRHGAAPPSF